jgi:hypothetical protein
MKKYLIAALITLLSLNTLLAQQPLTKPVEILGSTVVEVNANVGDMVEVVFALRNNSLDDFYIAQIQTDCHCINAVHPDMVKHLTTDSITVVLNTNNVPPGTFVKKAYLETPDNKVVELVLQGNLKVIKPITKAGQKPIIYKPVHVRLHNKQNELPQVQWLKTAHDFGYVKSPEPAKTEFTLRNLGPQPIEIKSVEPGCSCTISDYTKGPIPANQTATVTAAFTTKGAFGYFKKFIKVELTDGRTYQLAITGNVDPM